MKTFICLVGLVYVRTGHLRPKKELTFFLASAAVIGAPLCTFLSSAFKLSFSA